jgi:hypothetical protein
MLASDDDESSSMTTEQLPEPFRKMVFQLETCADHPAAKWFDRIGNGVFEDDVVVQGLPAPWPVYRFRRGAETAYVWEQSVSWFVRPWQTMRGKRAGRKEVTAG